MAMTKSNHKFHSSLFMSLKNLSWPLAQAELKLLKVMRILTLLHSEWSKPIEFLAILSAIGLKYNSENKYFPTTQVVAAFHIISSIYN